MTAATRYLTTAEAAEILGVSERRVRQFCEEGRLGQQIGRNWAITEHQVLKFAEKERPTGAPKKAKRAKGGEA